MRETVALCAVATLLACGAAPSERSATKPNFVYILVDDLGYGDVDLELPELDVFRNPHVETPRLANFAAQSLVLTDHYSASPVCSPSRAGLLTGRTPERADIRLWINDVRDNDTHFLSGKELTVAEVLGSAGYTSAVIGKWHLNGADWESKAAWTGWTGSFPKQQGFDYAIVSKENPHETRRLEQNTQDNPGDFFDGDGNPLGTVTGWTSQLITDWAVRWLEELRDRSKPFFLYLPYDAVHERVENPSEYTSLYATGDPDRDLYYGNITYLDYQIGRFLDALDRLGLEEDTVVFFSSDNGPEVCKVYSGAWRSYGTSWPYRGQKRQVLEGGVRVPGMVRWVGKIEPRVSGTPNSTLDVLPTLAELAGAHVPSHTELDGASLAGHFLRGDEVVRSKPLFWQFERRGENWTTVGDGYQRRYDGRRKIADPVPQVAIRDGDYVLRAYGGSRPYSELERFKLFDINRDRDESFELSATEPMRFESMKQALLAMHADVNRDRLERQREIAGHVDAR